jgi:tetratricopeptide (TPR) repeat protein
MWRLTSSRIHKLALAASLVIITAAVYAPLAGHDFVNFDDNLYVYENSHVRQGLTAESLRWAFTTFHASNWHPLTWCAHMLDVELFGLWPGGHHLSSLALHILNTLLLFFLLGSLTGCPGRSWLVAILFALHPAHVESVAWVAERKDVLSTLFWFLTLAAYAAWARNGKRGFYRLSLVLFGLGLMAKPMLVTVPLTMLLLDFWPLARFPAWEGLRPPPAAWRAVGRLVLEKLPFFLLTAASSVVTLLAQRTAMVSFQLLSLPERLAISLLSYAQYLAELFWPVNLAVFYPLPRTIPIGTAIAAGVGLLSVTAAALWMSRRRPWFLTGWIWYLATMVPVIGLIQVGSQSRADRYTYVPYVGMFILLVWGVAEAVPGRWKAARWGKFLAAAAIVGGLAGLTVRQEGYWRDSIALFEHAVAVTTHNDKAHNNLAVALLAAGRFGEAEAQIRAAVAIHPKSAIAQSNLGTLYFARGRTQEAIRQYRKAQSLAPANPDFTFKLGSALHKEGRLDEAARWYCRTLLLEPDHPLAHFFLGEIMMARGQPETALLNLRWAVRGRPDLEAAWISMGRILAERGDMSAAAEAWARVVRLNPDVADVQYNLGTWLAKNGRLGEAIPHLEAAVRLRPEDARSRNNLGSALLLAGRPAEAIPQLEIALRLQPAYPQAIENLRRARARLDDR